MKCGVEIGERIRGVVVPVYLTARSGNIAVRLTEQGLQDRTLLSSWSFMSRTLS